MNPKLIREHITKIETIELINNPPKTMKLLPNSFRTKDRFSIFIEKIVLLFILSLLAFLWTGPSSENTGTEAVGTHLNLTEMGIPRDKVFFVDSVSSEEFKVAKRELESAGQVGFDCEFKP